MNHHQRLLPPGVNRAFRYISLLLLALISSRETAAMPRLLRLKSDPAKMTSSGYLPAVGAPALRFQEAPAVLAPMHSTPLPQTASLSRPGSLENPPEVPSTLTALEVASITPQEIPTVEAATEKTSLQKARPAQQIIRDDTHPSVRPEDFLPFFQFPGSAVAPTGNLNVIVPVPRDAPSSAPLAPSSANYTQTPK
ncbi:MAG: hypothetical protein ABIZ81_14755 [Opitutaceae bacterium]